MTPDLFEKRLARERRARLESERLLELKSAELYTANLELAKYADDLTEEIESTQKEYFAAKSKADTLEDQTIRIQEDLDNANKAVFRAEQRLWQGVASIQDGFALFDSDNKLVAANPSYSSFLSLFMRDVPLGLHYNHLLAQLAKSELIDFGNQTAQAWLDGLIHWHNLADQSEQILLLKGDHWLRASERRTDGGDTVSLVSDITLAKRRERELDDARAAAEAANRAKSAFLANMSHEIRTPMNGVVGMADLLCETALSEEQQLFAQTIRNSGEALLVIINDVLDYSKIEADRLELFPEPFNLERCVHEVVTLLQPTAKEKMLDLLIDYDMFLPAHYVGDVGRFRQVLTNLVGNAVKFTEKGFVLVRVVGIEGADGKQEIHVAIEDSGIGIPPDKLDHIFGEFNQVDDQASRKFEGTGLGLAITQRLITLMGGEIWADSTLGKGSCIGFKIELPVSAAKEPPLQNLGPAITRALVVDDLEVNRLILSRQLGFLGLEATCCSSVASALQHIAQPDCSFDVILSDHQMPVHDGVELARELKRNRSNIPIYLLSSSGSLSSSLMDEGLFAGCLRKPILRRELRDCLYNLSHGIFEETTKPVTSPRLVADAPLPKLRLLTAEDNRTNQLVLSKIMRHMNVELEFANNGVEALEKFQTESFDLIFMDISMPLMDGVEATRRIREIEVAGNLLPVPIVALTAHAMAGDSERFLAAGMDHYLTKPLKKSVIEAKITEIIASGSFSKNFVSAAE